MQSVHPEIVWIQLPTPFPVGPVNAFLVKGDVPVLIDVGPKSEDAYQALTACLKEHGLAVCDIGIIFMTHGHVDHGGLLSRLLGESHAQAYAHPAVIEDIRGEGLMLGIKCKVPNTSLQAAAVAEKLLTIGAGDNVVRLLPPLVITRADVDEALQKLDRACKAVTPAAA